MRPEHPQPGAYRETIRHSASGERKYIRYFDGRGHFADVRLQLTPHPGASCSVSVDAVCPLPEEASIAAQRALSDRFDRGSPHRLPLIGFEVRITGGSYLPRHSYPEAFAIAASMAFEEALQHAAPMIVEPYTGISLLVEFDALPWTIRTLNALLGELCTTLRATDVVRLDVEIPVRLLKEIESIGLRIFRVFPLPKDMQYREVAAPGGAGGVLPDPLDQWT